MLAASLTALLSLTALSASAKQWVESPDPTWRIILL